MNFMIHKYKVTVARGPKNTYSIDFANDTDFLSFFIQSPGLNKAEIELKQEKLLAWAKTAKVGDRTNSHGGSLIEKVA